MRNPVEGEARSGVALLFMRPQLLHTERFFRVPAGMGSAPCWLVHKNGTFDSTSGASQSKVPLNAANGSSKRLIGHRQTRSHLETGQLARVFHAHLAVQIAKPFQQKFGRRGRFGDFPDHFR